MNPSALTSEPGRKGDRMIVIMTAVIDAAIGRSRSAQGGPATIENELRCRPAHLADISIPQAVYSLLGLEIVPPFAEGLLLGIITK
jgi:hypothetical protein